MEWIKNNILTSDMAVMISSLTSVIGAGFLAKNTESSPDPALNDEEKVQYGVLRSCAIILLAMNILCVLLVILDKMDWFQLIRKDADREKSKARLYLIYCCCIVVVLSVAVNSLRLIGSDKYSTETGLLSTGLAFALIGVVSTGYNIGSGIVQQRRDVEASTTSATDFIKTLG